MAAAALLLLAEKKLSKLSSLFVDGSQFVSYSSELDVDALLESHPDLVVLHKAGYDCVLSADDADAARRWELLQRLPRARLLEPLEHAVKLSDHKPISVRFEKN